MITPALFADIEESDAKSKVGAAERQFQKFKRNKMTQYASNAEKFLDEAKKQILEEEWDVAFYFAEKCLAYIELGRARKYNQNMQAKLKATKARLKK